MSFTLGKTHKPVEAPHEAPQFVPDESDTPASMRALELLRLVSDKPGELSLSDLAVAMDLSKSTVHRLVDQLTRAGYLYREPDQRVMWIGSKLRDFSLSVIHNDFVRSSVKTVLNELADTVGETCNLASLDGTEIIYLQRVETRWPLRLSLDLASRIPVHCCASGKLFLALLESLERQRILKRIGLTQVTDKTITRRADLEAEMKKIMACGYALDNEEFIACMVAIAVPIRNENGQIRASLSIHCPTIRCPNVEHLIQWEPLLREYALKFEALMG